MTDKEKIYEEANTGGRFSAIACIIITVASYFGFLFFALPNL